MHAPETARPPSRTPDELVGVLDFLWLELTNRCNLQCVHCYTESSPHTGDRDLLSAADYEDVMAQAHRLGCRKLQFIGGEPQLNRSFDQLLRAGVGAGFEFVEVFTNLTTLKDRTVEFAAEAGVCFATSVYSDDPEVHDAVTTVRGSHRRTISNLRRLVDRGITTRAGVITMNDGDDEAAERTTAFLRELGVGHVRTSQTREFGRGEDVVGRAATDEGLCGHCWNGSLAVAPDGLAYPCVMARDRPVGDITAQTLQEIVHGAPLSGRRETIYEQVWLPKTVSETPICPQTCVPDLSCPCDPLLCPQSCTPWILHEVEAE